MSEPTPEMIDAAVEAVQTMDPPWNIAEYVATAIAAALVVDPLRQADTVILQSTRCLYDEPHEPHLFGVNPDEAYELHCPGINGGA